MKIINTEFILTGKTDIRQAAGIQPAAAEVTRPAGAGRFIIGWMDNAARRLPCQWQTFERSVVDIQAAIQQNCERKTGAGDEFGNTHIAPGPIAELAQTYASNL